MAETTSVQAFFTTYGERWKANDPIAVAHSFTPDGSIINPFGERADGRAELERIYTTYFAGMLKGTSTVVGVQSVRPAGERHALVDCDQKILAPDGSVVLALHLTALLQRDGASWLIPDARPYGFAPVPS